VNAEIWVFSIYLADFKYVGSAIEGLHGVLQAIDDIVCTSTDSYFLREDNALGLNRRYKTPVEIV
jgi:hypothetical protein